MTPLPPQIRRQPVERAFHGHVFPDPYEWMRDKESPEVLEHLAAENDYAEASTAHLAGLRETIFGEIKGRTQETDLSVPNRRGDWWYFSRTVEGGAHQVFCRVPAATTGDLLADWTPPVVEPGTPMAGEEVLLDANAESEKHEFYSLGSFDVAEDGSLLAWAEDVAGDERFVLRVKDLGTGELLPDEIPGTFYGAFLSPDARAVYYTVVDESWRPHQLRRHVLGTPVADDAVVHEETDPGLWLGAGLSADRRWIVVEATCSEFSEVRIQPVDEPAAEPRVVLSRADRVLYEAEPFLLDGRELILLTHDHEAPNSRVSLMDPVDLGRPVAEVSLRDVVPASETERVNGCAVTASHLVVSVRADTTLRVRLVALAALTSDPAAAPVEPAFDEELYTATVSAAEHDAPVVRLSYTSFTTPPRVYDVFVSGATGDDDALPAQPVLRREATVLGGYDPADYAVERDWATAADGTRIPISLVRRADLDPSVPAPVLQYAYGSYEHSTDPAFSVSRLSLLDRGVIWAVAHVRGGGELGRAWYEHGKKLRKANTFTDYVAVTEHLAARPDVDEHRILVMGGSAGGLLVGAVLNLAPEKYCGALAAVPFVDPLTSILDPSLPLTALEWEEWGNPIEDPHVYRYMRDYSPYENVRPLPYPPVLAVTSLNDTRVLYVEPAKWVASLREATTSGQPVLLRCEMAGGHGGASGRYSQWKDTAWEYAWVLDRMGLAGA
ncbi:oligopeptidase B [Kocuria dechangensis]|uniref:Oligopeptidase B n=1 Tax=Kocuria dechangensis TaxID=1176249 RepID=A0A917LMK0_9MICC|nr:S9 family peptidase [Kocuria dechangensis]GGG43841.1 oligopeptidase B [Kocuria dechangensis]